MTRNDPDVLEREADELIEQFQREQNGIQEGDQARADTPEDAEEDDQTLTETPSETSESAEGEGDEPAESGEQDEPTEDDPETDDVSELREQLRVAEERYRNAQARMTKATQEAATFRRENESLKERITVLESKAEQQSAKPTGDADLDKLMEDFPDVVGPLVAEVRQLKKAFSLKEEKDASSAEQTALERHFAQIDEAHSDWEDIVAQDDWAGWVSRQSPLRQRAAQEGNASEVIELLDSYKRDMGLSPSRQQEPEQPDPPQNSDAKKSEAVERARKIAEPRTPRARQPDPNAGKRVFTQSEIARMPVAEFERLEAEIDLAAAEGRVVSG